MTLEHDHSAFPGAPPDAWVCYEGWLVVGDEAWTPDEWRTRGGRPTVYDDARHRKDRERKRRYRARMEASVSA